MATSEKHKQLLKPGLSASCHIHDRLYVLAVLALFSLCFFIAVPWGNFPVNDDMIYGTAVKGMVETGIMRILVTNAFDFIPLQIGSLVCSIFGFSYDNLRLLTFVFGLFAAVPIYFSLREIGSKSQQSALLTAICMLSPFILNLTCTFMSDIPALAFTTWSILFSLRAIESGITHKWIIAVVFLTAAIVTRQNAVAFLPALLLFAALNTASTSRRFALLAFGTVLPATAYIATNSWLKSCLIRTVCLENYTNGVFQSVVGLLDPATLIFTFAKFSAVLGLLALPLTVPFAALLIERLLSSRSRHTALSYFELSRKQVIFSVVFSVASTVIPLLVLLLIQHHAFPFYQNLFSPPYIGTYQIIGSEQIWPVKHLKTLSYFSVTAASLLAFCLALFVSTLASACLSAKSCLGLGKRDVSPSDLEEHTRSSESELSHLARQSTKAVDGPGSNSESKTAISASSIAMKQGLFLACVFLSGLLATMVQLSTIGLDRYVTTLWVPLCLIVGWLMTQIGASKFVHMLYTLALVASAVYAVFCLNDCMNLNRAQWQALSYLEQKGVNPLLIDGGQEYNFQHGGNACITGIDPKTKKWPEYKRGGPERAKLRWWPINGEDYIISCLPIDGYTKIAEFNYWNTLKWRSRQVFVLQAEAPLDRY